MLGSLTFIISFPFPPQLPLPSHCCPDSVLITSPQVYCNDLLTNLCFQFGLLQFILYTEVKNNLLKTIRSHHSLTKNPSVALSTVLKLISKYSIQALNDLNLFGLTSHKVALFCPSPHTQPSYPFISMH